MPSIFFYVTRFREILLKQNFSRRIPRGVCFTYARSVDFKIVEIRSQLDVFWWNFKIKIEILKWFKRGYLNRSFKECFLLCFQGTGIWVSGQIAGPEFKRPSHTGMIKIAIKSVICASIGFSNWLLSGPALCPSDAERPHEIL